jgi:MFS family permease
MSSPGSSRFFYGYYITAACFFILFFLWGMVFNTFPIFLKPIAVSMNWGRGELAIALLVGSVASAIASPLAGTLIDRIGAKKVMAVGAAVVGVAIIAESRITELWHLYVLFGFIGLGLMCSTIIPCSLLISNWFVARRGAAMSAAFVGTSFGGMVMSPVANWIIINHGWRTAFVFSGSTILIIVVPLILFVIRTHPSEMGLTPYQTDDPDGGAAGDVWGVGVKDAFSLKAFWQIAAIMLIISVAYGGLGNHCVAYLTDLDHSPTRAAFAWSLVMGAMVLGKIAFGPLADRRGAKVAMAISCVIFSISIGFLIFAKPFGMVLIFACLYGFACGAPLVINPLLTGDYLGVKNFATLYGILNIMGTIGGAIGPVGAGYVFDTYHTYLPVFYFFIPLMLLCGLIAITMKPIPKAVLPVNSG